MYISFVIVLEGFTFENLKMSDTRKRKTASEEREDLENPSDDDGKKNKKQPQRSFFPTFPPRIVTYFCVLILFATSS